MNKRPDQKFKWDFGNYNGKSLAGTALVDNQDGGHFMGGDHPSAGQIHKEDNPNLAIGDGGLQGTVIGPDSDTTIDVRFNFTAYAVWNYDDGTYVVLGKTKYTVEFSMHIVLANWNLVTMQPGANNKITPSQGFVRLPPNAVPDVYIVPPGANEGDAKWR